MSAPHLKGGSDGVAVSEPVALADTLRDCSRSWGRCRRAVSGAVGLDLLILATEVRLNFWCRGLRLHWLECDAANSGAAALCAAPSTAITTLCSFLLLRLEALLARVCCSRVCHMGVQNCIYKGTSLRIVRHNLHIRVDTSAFAEHNRMIDSTS